MSDSLRRYCAIQKGLVQRLPTPPTGNPARRLRTLAALVSGIIGSRQVQLPAIATKTSTKRTERTKRESRIKSYQRWLNNRANTAEAFYLPYALALIASLPPGPLVLIMDGSEVGRGCLALVISVVYQKRALPLCWWIVRAKKGHFPEEAHVALLEKASRLIPAWRSVLFLGDGEFDGIGLLAAVAQKGWHYVCRTAKNVRLGLAAETVGMEPTWQSPAQLLAETALCPGEALALADVLFTAQSYGPVQVALIWEPGYKEPLFLVSNLTDLTEASHWYRQRFRIETFFSDQKSRGFSLHKSHLTDPERLARLMIGTCLAYLWLVCLGARVVVQERVAAVHRSDRCDLSLFQLGALWLEHCLNHGTVFRFMLRLPRCRNLRSESVR